MLIKKLNCPLYQIKGETWRLFLCISHAHFPYLWNIFSSPLISKTLFSLSLKLNYFAFTKPIYMDILFYPLVFYLWLPLLQWSFNHFLKVPAIDRYKDFLCSRLVCWSLEVVERLPLSFLEFSLCYCYLSLFLKRKKSRKKDCTWYKSKYNIWPQGYTQPVLRGGGRKISTPT